MAVLDRARSSGYGRLWAAVWDWNTASRRVLAKVGFTETERKEVDAVHGTTLFTTIRLSPIGGVAYRDPCLRDLRGDGGQG